MEMKEWAAVACRAGVHHPFNLHIWPKVCHPIGQMSSMPDYRPAQPGILKDSEHACSRLIWEAKQGWGWLLLGWETTWE